MVAVDSLTPDEWTFWDQWMRAQERIVRELGRSLQLEHGITKAEFSILVTLHAAAGPLRVTDLADALGWDKSRVAHQLTRMQRGGHLHLTSAGTSQRRRSVALSDTGRQIAERAIHSHGSHIRSLVLDDLAPEQTTAIRSWSRATLAKLPGQANPGDKG
jgi:DNA-binding MarR family transcriptional regulator